MYNPTFPASSSLNYVFFSIISPIIHPVSFRPLFSFGPFLWYTMSHASSSSFHIPALNDTSLPLPPLPSLPYAPDTLAAYISNHTLNEVIDLTSGQPSGLTSVDATKVRAWWSYRSIRFSRQANMLELDIEPRLRFLKLNQAMPDTLGLGRPSTPEIIRSEDDLLSYIRSELRSPVNRIVKACQRAHPKTTGRYPKWASQPTGSARPHDRLYSFAIADDVDEQERQRMVEVKELAYLKRIMKLLANQAAGEGFRLMVKANGTTVLEGDGWRGEKESIRRILTQVG